MQTLLKSLIVFVVAVAGFSSSVRAALVNSSGYTNAFGIQPVAADWTTMSIGGAAGTLISAADIDNAVQAIAASSINTALTADPASPPAIATTAVWSSGGLYVQTRATGNNATLMMLTLVNNLGGDAAAVNISYDFAKNAIVAEEIEGHRAYYSLTGAAGSWVVIPAFSSATPGRLTANLNVFIPVGGTFYIVWADDNGSGSPDTALQIDNISVSLTPAAHLPAAITGHPQSQTVGELQPVTFTASVIGTPTPTLQWYTNNVAVTGATNLSYNIPSTPLGYSSMALKLVAQNVASNVTYNVTSSVATLTVNADTVRPVLLGAVPSGLTRVVATFSERLAPASVANVANYSVTGPGSLIISNAVLDGSQTNLTITVGPMTPGAIYTLTINNVTDQSAAANSVAANSQVQFTAAAIAFADIGTPLPGGTVTAAGNGYNITAGGADIGGISDQFTFSYEIVAGDFDVKVRVQGLSLSDSWAKAGLMARESVAANARYAATFETPSISGSYFQYRTNAGGNSFNAGAFPATYPNAWIRLKRVGDVFTGYASLDGNTWSLLGTLAFPPPMPSSLLVGFAVSSHTNGVPTTAQFRDYATVSGNPPVASLTLPMEPLGPSSRRTPLVISEIMYHPRNIPGQPNSAEFIEIFNSQAFDERVGGYKISGAVDYTIPTNTVIKSGGFLVIARDPAFIQSHYGITGVLGPWDGLMTNVTATTTNVVSTNGLPGSTGTVRLRSRAGAVLLEVNYIGGNPWPLSADGAGHSLVLNRPSYGEGDVRAWAASDSVDGSPGRPEPFSADPLRNVVINELLAHTDPINPAVLDYVELYNHGNQAIDISGAVLTDESDTNKFRIPNGTVLAPRGFVTFTESALGFALRATGERIFLINSNGTRVIDAVDYDAQANGRSTGRVPDGSPYFYPLASLTPGAANGTRWLSPVVINEIMFRPISGDDDDEYIELYNRSTNTVDMSQWRLDEGVSFSFPPSTLLAPGGYLVVARSSSNLLAHYPGVLNSANTVGNFDGRLANSGERIALLMPAAYVTTNGVGQLVTNTIRVLANDVTYGDGGRWGYWTDGGGSSLELKDPNSDTRQSANWADSDETAKSANLWTSVDFTGPLGESLGTPINDNLQIFLLGIGECLVDEVELHNGAGPNIIANPSFESGLSGWTLQGSHDFSTIENVGYLGNQSLHLRAASRGDNGANRIRSSAITVTSPVTIRAKVRWLRGWPEILLRVHGGTAEAIGRMEIPLNLGSPGQRNSRAVTNAGPAIYDVAHSPILPQANEAVVVTARVNDPNGIGSLALRSRVDANITVVTPALFTSTTMVDDGTSGDAIAGDGIYSATISGKAAGAFVTFYVQAVDGLGATNLFPQNVFPEPGFTRTFPNDSPTRECVIRWGEVQMPGSFATYHLWLSYATSNRWAVRTPQLNNAELDGTFVYNNSRVVYNALPQYAGSPWHRGQMTAGPAGNSAVDYVMNFPTDDRMLGNTDFVLNNPGNPGGSSTSDGSAQTEQTSYKIFEEIGIVYNYRRYVHVFVNGSHRSRNPVTGPTFIFEDSQQPNGDMISEWFPDDTDGDFYKIEDWFEFPDNGFDFTANNDADLVRRTILLNGKPTMVIAPYRFMYRKRSVAAGEDSGDYTNLFNLINAASPASSPSSATIDPGAFGSIADYEQWMRIFAVQRAIGNWDSYGYNRGKNDYTYKPRNGKFQQMTWDIDFTVGVGGDGTGEGLFTRLSDPRMVAMYNTPAIVRAYLRAFLDIINGPMNNAFMDPILDAKHAALRANGVNADVNTVNTIKNFIAARRTFLAGQLASAMPAFSVSGSTTYDSVSNVTIITGVASVAIKDITVNGAIYPVTWSGPQTAPTTWTIRVPLNVGTNSLVIQGLDGSGNPVAGSSRTLAVNFTGSLGSPVGNIIFNEIMHNPLLPNASYVELFNRSATSSFDVSGWTINGLDFTFPAGSIIGATQYLVVAKDRAAFGFAYGFFAPYQFEGSLQNDGETLTLIKPGTTNTPALIVDRVRYEGAPPWSTNANGSGSSFQLIDPNQENARTGNWFANFVPAIYCCSSSTPARTNDGWQFVTGTGLIGSGSGGGQMRLVIYLGTELGTALIDDVWMVDGTNAMVGVNYVRNGDFESALVENPLLTNSWMVGTNYTPSAIVSGLTHSGNGALKLVPTTFGNSVTITATTTNNRVIYQALSPAPLVNSTNTLSFWYWATNSSTNLTIKIVNSAAGTVNVTTNINITYTPSNYVPPQVVSPATNTLSPGAANQNVTALPAFPPLWINEVLAENITGLTDSYGQREPWIEIYNTSSNAVSLEGLFLSSSYTNLTNWAFPAGASIGPTQFLVVFADGQSVQTSNTEYHTSFRLPATSGSVALSRLYTNAPQVLDYVNYAGLHSDKSFGSYPDGQPFDRQEFFYVTPRGTNDGRSAPLVVFINEWLASNVAGEQDPADGDFDDWFEIFNPGSNTVDLAGYYLTDSLTNVAGVVTNKLKYLITTNGPHTIAPRGYLLVWADNETGQNTSLGVPRSDLHVNFQLARTGEALGLFAADGLQIDYVTFGFQDDDVTVGRIPDGGANIVAMPGSASPRAANYLVGPANTPPVLNPIGNKSVNLGQTLTFTATASDVDLPAQILTYDLVNAPAGATIVSGTGAFSWTPTVAGTFAVTIRVTDNGAPAANDTETIQVQVTGLTFGGPVRRGSNLELNWGTQPGTKYAVDTTTNLNTPINWQPVLTNTAVGPSLTYTNATTNGVQRFFRVRSVP